MKLVPACLSGRKDQESRFHRFGGPAKLVQVCLSGRKDQKRKFHPCGGPAKLVPVSQEIRSGPIPIRADRIR